MMFQKHMGSAVSIAAYHELTGGMFNAAYRVDLADGSVCVLKAAPPPDVRVLRYERDILRTEVDVLRLVKARTAMPAPTVLFHDESCDLLPSACFAMEFIFGEPMNRLRPGLSQKDQRHIDRACGGYLRQMNAINGEAFGLFMPLAPRFNTWRDAFDRLLKDVLVDGEEAGVELPLGYVDMLALARQHYTALDEVTRPSLVHWDLWDGNIFINPLTCQVSGLIDFERALWADPLMEVNFSLFAFNEAFLEGYLQDGWGIPGGNSGSTSSLYYDFKYEPVNKTQKTRRLLYDLYLFLIMVIECAYRRYPTDDQENWARGKLGEVILGLEGMI